MPKVLDKKYPARCVQVLGSWVQFDQHKATVSPRVALELIKRDEFALVDGEKPVPYNRMSWEKYRRLLWIADADTFSGFGTATMSIVKTLKRLGVDVRYGGIRHDASAVVDKEFDAISTDCDVECMAVQFCQPGQFRRLMADRMFGYTPWETTRLPPSWVPKMNKMEVMFTTCLQQAQAFKDSGVTVPVHVFHHGFDPAAWPLLDREETDEFVFGTFARLSVRKGTDVLIKAFTDEFKNEDDVRLLLKSSDMIIPFGGTNDRRIVRMGNVLSQPEMLNLLRIMDCFVFPSRGEGFGLPALQAMATGVPCILTNWSGLVDFSDKGDTLLLDYKMTPAEEFTKGIYKEPCGEWAEPSYEDLRAKMRFAYEHRKRIRAMGKRASKRVHSEWTWDKVATSFIKDLDTLA